MAVDKSDNVLVALLPSNYDFEIAKNQGWYRIPVKSAPPIVRENRVKILAFYHPKTFELEHYSIRWYAEVKQVSIVKRKELFPNEAHDEKSDAEYYKLQFQTLRELPKPIVSLSQRRVVFIPTSEQKFFNATEINQLFNESKLEDILWAKFVENKIPAERQFSYNADNKWYFLDFAIFCKDRNINVECDGDKFHTGHYNVQYDKDRNNQLESKGWSVMRFTTDNLTQNLNESFGLVCEAINKYGGIKDEKNKDSYRLIRPDIYTGFLFLDDI